MYLNEVANNRKIHNNSLRKNVCGKFLTILLGHCLIWALEKLNFSICGELIEYSNRLKETSSVPKAYASIVLRKNTNFSLL